MNKTDLILKLTKISGLKKNVVSKLINDTFNVIIEELSSGNEVSISKFGKFALSVRKSTKERTFFSSIAKKEITIPSKGETNKVSFKSSKNLNEQLNS